MSSVAQFENLTQHPVMTGITGQGEFAPHVEAASTRWHSILSQLFDFEEPNRPLFNDYEFFKKCYANAQTGRLLWIFTFHHANKVDPSYVNTLSSTFIIEINFADTSGSHAPHTERLVRREVSSDVIPWRSQTRQITTGRDGKYSGTATVYEAPRDVENLADLMKRGLATSVIKPVVADLVRIKKALSTISPPEADFDIFSDPQSPLRTDPDGPVLHMAYDLSKWDITCAERHDIGDFEVVRHAKPILALLNRHIPDGHRASADVSLDGDSITLWIPGTEEPVCFSGRDMKFLKDNMFLHQALVDPCNVFIQNTGYGKDKKWRVAAILGWDSAEYCPVGYSMGQLDAKFGKELKDTLWYLVSRREGLKKKNPNNATSDPAQVKLAQVMYIMTSCRTPRELTFEERKAEADRKSWLNKRKFSWKGAAYGWQTGFWQEVKNIIRDQTEHLH